MAVTTEITTDMRAADLPDGYSAPSTTITFSGTPIEEASSHTFAAAGIDNATAATTMANILSAVKTEVDDNWIPDTLKLDATATINGIIYVTRIRKFIDQTSKFQVGTIRYTVYFTLKYE